MFEQEQCLMRTVTADCETVTKPTHFEISTETSSPLVGAAISLRDAITEQLPVVSCVSPLFYNERWHVNVFSIEYYAYFGVSRQAYYYVSVLESGFRLLKVSQGKPAS